MDWPTRSFGMLLGLRHDFRDGVAFTEIDFSEDVQNPYRVMHGAVIYSLIDDGMGLSVVRTLEPQQRCATVEISVRYLAAVLQGKVIAETRIVNRAKRIVTLQSDVRNSEGKLVAIGIGTFYVFDEKAER